MTQEDNYANPTRNQTVIDLLCETDNGETVTATATVTLPAKK